MADQTAYVGSELIIEIRATDPDLEIIRFSFDSTLDSLSGRAMIEPTGNGAALFRWTPLASDVGTWAIDFRASDSNETTTETILVEVRAIADGAPVFRRPIAPGATLDLEQTPCINVEIEIEDPDTPNVDIVQVEPVLTGATLVQDSGTLATWRWCPSADQAAASDRHVLILGADDRENAPTLKHFLIILRGDQVAVPVDLTNYRLHQLNATCVFTLPEGTLVEPGGGIIVARDATKAAFEDAWAKKLPSNVLFFDSGDSCPQLNGDETFRLVDPTGFSVDGVTIALDANTNIQRTAPTSAPGLTGSWAIDVVLPLEVTPGVAANRDIGSGKIWISEVSDAVGTGNFVYEFVEISVD
jgi:hypothetical protein